MQGSLGLARLLPWIQGGDEGQKGAVSGTATHHQNLAEKSGIPLSCHNFQGEGSQENTVAGI